MVIAPNSTILLYSALPIDSSYDNTLYFETLSAQTAFFTSPNNQWFKRKFELNTYQRVNSGVFEAKCLADDIYDVNYMAFQNTNYGNKWFYAFIDTIEYVNNGNTRITYTIDVIQSYFFDADLEYCFVEREHSASDVIGEHILPEPLSCGEYVFTDYSPVTELRDSAIICATVDVINNTVNGNRYDRIYGGLTLTAFKNDSSGASALNTFIKSFVDAGRPDAVQQIYVVPLMTVQLDSEHPLENNTTLGGTDTGTFKNKAFTSANNLTNIDGYYPVKNKKLFTYPFNYFHVDDGDGNGLALRYEFFDSVTPRLQISCGVSLPIQACCYPLGYKGLPYSGSGIGENYPLLTEKLTLASYPLCSWNYDTYQAWIAQNAIPMVLGAMATPYSIGIASQYPQGYIGANKLGGVAGILTTVYKASILADTCRGNIESGNNNFTMNRMTFNTARCHITAEQAESFDMFFTKYGYACNKVKVPNRSARPKWNYVKTNGCEIRGSCPAESIKKICEIYDNGITFWKNASEVGRYYLDNSPTANP